VSGMTVMSALRRVTGLGAAGGLAFALLAAGCVLAATAGPRQTQATQAEALQQTVSRLPPLDQAIVVNSSWADANEVASNTGSPFQGLSQTDFDNVTAQLRRDFTAPPLRPAPLPRTGGR
jgi:hypothetical protein